MLLLPHHDNWRECDCVCVYVCVRLVVRDELMNAHTHTLSHIQACMWLVGVFCPSCAVTGSWDPLRSQISDRALEQLGLCVD